MFGSHEPISGALRGTVYRIPKSTSWLPDLTSLQSVGTLYTTTLDYDFRPYGDEWFAIRYEGSYYVSRPGEYHFWLTSDDGAQLWIDDKRVINNDGVHEVRTEDQPVRLETGMHRIRVPYFQGPVPYVALVLEVKPPGGKKRLFDTTDFPIRSAEADSPEDRPRLQRK